MGWKEVLRKGKDEKVVKDREKAQVDEMDRTKGRAILPKLPVAKGGWSELNMDV